MDPFLVQPHLSQKMENTTPTPSLVQDLTGTRSTFDPPPLPISLPKLSVPTKVDWRRTYFVSSNSRESVGRQTRKVSSTSGSRKGKSMEERRRTRQEPRRIRTFTRRSIITGLVRHRVRTYSFIRTRRTLNGCSRLVLLKSTYRASP